MAVVTGRAALDVPAEEAIEYIFGYTVVNDVSARDVQYGWGGQFFKGKSFDGFCPLAPGSSPETKSRTPKTSRFVFESTTRPNSPRQPGT